MATTPTTPWILGLDLGVASVGWAALHIQDGAPCGLLDAGSRIFDAGLDNVRDSKGGIARGTGKATQRREARQRRRQTDRRTRRMAQVYTSLADLGLLPSLPPGSDGPQRGAALNGLYARVTDEVAVDRRFVLPGLHVSQVLTYLLRQRALTEALSPHALGLTLYTLVHRRGFFAHRKRVDDDDRVEQESDAPAPEKKAGRKKRDPSTTGSPHPKKLGPKDAMAALERDIAAAGKQTLGQYLADVNPHMDRIRGRHKARALIRAEFDAIWNAQARHHPALTEAARSRVARAAFHQRPLRSQDKYVGNCEFLVDRKRAPWASLDAQRFRLLQAVNDLRILSRRRDARPLSPEQRASLLDLLSYSEKLSLGDARDLLELAPSESLNLERGGRRYLSGDQIRGRMQAIDSRFRTRADDEQRAIFLDIWSYEHEDALAKRLMRRWGYDAEQAERLAHMQLPEEYCSLSTAAIRRLLPKLEEGTAYTTACREVFPEAFKAKAPLDRLQPVGEFLPSLRHPLVARTLSELRRVVNALLERYGKPERVHVELGRDLMRSAEERKRISKSNRSREDLRESARAEIASGPARTKDAVTDRDVEKWLLWNECGKVCPYTGASISFIDLFGKSPSFDIEHIVPFSRCLDDSMANKTLCATAKNREKLNRTPREAFEGTAEWGAMQQRAEAWAEAPGLKPDERQRLRRKCDRFLIEAAAVEALLGEFADRELQATRYASKVAADYLAGLYGERWDTEGGNRRVLVGSGLVTSYLRDVWRLNRVLSSDGRKNRHDHRHHAIDAICVALTTQRVITDLSNAASNPGQRENSRRPRRFGDIVLPWASFPEDVQSVINGIVVSHRIPRVGSGALHQETHYSPPLRGPDGEPAHHVRKPLVKLSKKDVANIVDPRVREAVVQACAGAMPEKVFKSPANLPRLRPDLPPIRAARIRLNDDGVEVGRGPRTRWVKTGNNAHLELWLTPGKKPKLDFDVVSLLELYRLKARGLPSIGSKVPPGCTFEGVVRIGDVFLLENRQGVPRYFRVAGLSAKKLDLWDLADARPSKLQREQKDRWEPSPATVWQSARGVRWSVSPLGEVVQRA